MLSRTKLMPMKNYAKILFFNSGRSHVHCLLCSGQADLQKDWQELSDERQQGMQLREELRLLRRRSVSLDTNHSTSPWAPLFGIARGAADPTDANNIAQSRWR